MKKTRTNMSQQPRISFEENPKNDFVSTKLCLLDNTWPSGNVGYVTLTPENKILNIMSEEPRNDLVSTELCLFDKTWPCGSSSYFREQTRKMEMEDDIEQNNIGSNDFVTLAPRNDESTKETERFEEIEDDIDQNQISSKGFITLAPRNEESTEQTRKNDDDMEQNQIGSNDLVTLDARNEESTEQTRKIEDDTDRFIIQKTLHKANMLQHLRLSKFDVNPFDVEYLSEDDQNKISKGCGIRVNMYDDESQTTHEGLMRQTKNNFQISGTWLSDFAHRRGLQVGDKIGLYWDSSRYTFHFRVLSRAPAQVKTSTAEVISGNEESKEQTRKMEDATDSEQHQMGLCIKKKTLHKRDICLCIGKTYFDANLLRYLSEDDQKKIKLGYGVRVNVYEDESQTTHKEVLLIQSRTLKQKYLLIGTWLQRRGLQAGDKIGLSWDFSRSMLHFRVLSRATAEGKTSTAEVISG